MNENLQQIKDSLYNIKRLLEQDLYSEDACTVKCAKIQILMIDKMIKTRASVALYN